MNLNTCHNHKDFRELARRRVPGPFFGYIDGGADIWVSKRRNAAAFDDCDLLPSVLKGVGTIDLSVTVMGQHLAMPISLSPTALQRVFLPMGEHAVGTAAAKFGAMFGVSSLGTTSIADQRAA